MTQRVRNPQLTRQRILDAATREFSAHGLSGARVDVIARKARINKRMLYHYFGGKEALFREVLLQRVKVALEQMAAVGGDPFEKLPEIVDVMAAHGDWIRLLQWEALAQGRGKVLGRDMRRNIWRIFIEGVERSQKRGAVPGRLDAQFLVLSVVALTMFPIAFPQLTQLITALQPDSRAFRKAQLAHLQALTQHLRGAPRHRT